MVLKPCFKKVKIESLSSSYYRIKERIKKECRDAVEFIANEGFQLFGIIDNEIYGVLEGPLILFMKMGFFNLR